MDNNIVSTFVEIDILENDNFLKIKETLSRMGVANQANKTLFQSCHILHKQGKYYLTHFKELLALDGRQTSFSEEDKARRNSIAKTLERWGLCRLVNPTVCEAPTLESRKDLFIVRFQDKQNWTFVQKYTIGKKK